MALTLQTIAADAAYIAKHNANYSAIQQAVEALQSASGNTVQANLTAPLGFEAFAGGLTSMIGAGSYAASTGGTSLTLAAGYLWDQVARAVVAKTTSTIIAFSGLAAATYYVHVDSAGTPIANTTAANAIYSVVWSGTGFGTLTALAPTVWAGKEFTAAMVSAALAATYDTLDARLEAGEAKAVLGDKAYTMLRTQTSKSVAGGATVALSATESAAETCTLTGALTANIDVTVALANSPRIMSVRNDTTGDFEINFKGSSGTGVIVPQGYASLLRHDGTNITHANTEAFVVGKIVPYAASITLDWSKYDTVHITLAGDCTITHTNARAGQKCLVYLAQDATGGRLVTWGAEVQYGSDIGGISLTATPSKTDEVGFSYNWVTSKFNCVSIAKGY